MAEPLRVAVRRGSFVESVHEVHGVAVRDGETVVSFGDPSLTASLRSSAKPLQALPLARAYPELGEEELAIASASHYATPRHIEAVRKLLAATGGSEDELDCGRQEGRPQEAIYDNCSGKHAGMLALARHHGWPTAGYEVAGHPVQDRIMSAITTWTGLPASEIVLGVDGCTVVRLFSSRSTDLLDKARATTTEEVDDSMNKLEDDSYNQQSDPNDLEKDELSNPPKK